jgi:hypothetical protein
MPPRSPLPADDLYLRLGVPYDASPEAIEVAWRGLLRRYHPDVAGPEALDLAKRINVAHDWLSDTELRRRYDRERVPRPASLRSRADRDGEGPPIRPVFRRVPTVAERVAVVVDRVGRLTVDELDRLALAEPAPIAFLATLRRFVTTDLQATLDDAERAAIERLSPAARRDTAIQDAVTGKLADLVVGDALDELLGDPAGARARERLTRGWDAAVGQPRYGPATPAVLDLLHRLATLSTEEVRRLASTGTRERLGEVPWPGWTSPEEDEALRVSSELASRDAATAIAASGTSERPVPAAARRAASRIAHLLVLRHAVHEVEFRRSAGPWFGDLIPRVSPWSTTGRDRR